MKCKSCNGKISPGDTECGDCGALVKTRMRVVSRHEKPSCSFHDGNRYCPAPGAWKRTDGPWFCYWHGQPEGKDRLQTDRLILDDLLSNGVRKVKDWRDSMVDLVMRGVTVEDARKQVFGVSVSAGG